MAYIGQWQVDDVLYFPANTHSPSTGVATDADSSPAYRVYENDTTTPILTGTMSLLDSANTAGLYMASITLSAANGFEVGKCYTIYVSATVGGITSTMAHTFQVEAALATSSALATLQTSVDDLPTNAELATSQAAADDATLAAIAALNNLSAAQVNAEVDTALADYDAPTKAELDDGLAGIPAPDANTIADAVLSRGVSNVEDTADTTSLAALILATFESSAVGTSWEIRKTAGGTFVTKTLTLAPDADPVTGVS